MTNSSKRQDESIRNSGEAEMEETNNGELKLGNQIQLSGFKSVDVPTIIVVKKMVGHYANKASSICNDFQKFSVHLKKVHTSIFELNGQLVDGGKVYSTKVDDRNLFFALNKVFEKLDSEIRR